MADEIVDQAAIHFRPDFRGFQADYRKYLAKLTPKKIKVGLELDTRGLQTKYRAALKALTPQTIKVKVELEVDKSRLSSRSRGGGVRGSIDSELRNQRKRWRDWEEFLDHIHRVGIRNDSDRLYRRVRDYSESITRAHVEALREDRRRRKAAQDAIFGDAKQAYEKQRKLNQQAANDRKRIVREQIREHERLTRQRDRLLAGGFNRGRNLGEGFIDLGGRGVRPMHALIAAGLALTPVLFSVASSALQASTSLVALAPAAAGVVVGFGALTFAFAGIADAFKQYVSAADGSEAAAEKFNQKIRELSPVARSLLGRLIELKEASKAFGYVMQEQALPGVVDFMDSLRRAGPQRLSVLDAFKVAMLDMGQTFSDTSRDAGRFFESSLFKRRFVTILANNQEAVEALSRAGLALLPALTRVFAAASPLVVRFANFVERLADRFATFIEKAERSGKLAEWFRRAGDEMAVWANIAGNLTKFILALFRVNVDEGIAGRLARNIEDLTARLVAWARSDRGQKQIQGFFEFWANLNYGAIAIGLGKVLLALLAFRTLAGIGAAITGTVGAIRSVQNLAARRAAQRAAGVDDIVPGGGGTSVITTGGRAGGAAGRGAATAGRVGVLGRLAGGSLMGLAAAATTAAAAFTGLYLASEKFRGTVKETGEIAKRSWEVFKEPVGDAWDDALKGIKETFERKGGLGEKLDELVPKLDQVGDGFARAFGQGTAGLISVAGGAVQFATDTVNVLAGAFEWLNTHLDPTPNASKYGPGARELLFGNRVGRGTPYTRVDDIFQRDASGNLSMFNQNARRGAPYTKIDNIFERDASGEVTMFGPGQGPRAGATSPFAAAKQLAENATNNMAKSMEARIRQARTRYTGQIRSLREAANSAAKEMADANRAVRDSLWGLDAAERSYADGLRERAQAQRDMTEARKEAAANIRQLRLEVKGLAATEEAALLRRDEAREALKSYEFSASADPLFKRGLRNDLALAQKDLNEQQAKGRETREALSEAERRGIDKAEGVINARERLRDISDDLIQRERAIVQANDAVAQAQDNARTASQRYATQSDALRKAVDLERQAVDNARIAYDKLKTTAEKPPKKKTQLQIYMETFINGKTTAQLKKLGYVTLPMKMGKDRAAVMADGGPVPGHSPNGRADNIPAWLTAKEYVHNTKTTSYYGLRNMENINKRRIPRQVLEQYGHDTPRKYADGGYVWPVPGYRNITSHFGQWRGNYAHGGTDIAAPSGAPIVSAAAGRVIQSGWYGGGGNTVSVGHAGNLVTRYMHMSRILAQLNQVVSAGTRLGLVGTTGDSTGNHLHFQAERPPGSKFNAMSLVGGAPIGQIPGPIQPGAQYGPPDPNRISTAAAEYVSNVMGATFAGKHVSKLMRAMGYGINESRGGSVFIPMLDRDQGGPVPTGLSLINNRTGRRETVRNAQQEQALNQAVRIDHRDLRLLASLMLDAAAGRPIQMDGRRVAEATAAHVYVPAGV